MMNLKDCPFVTPTFLKKEPNKYPILGHIFDCSAQSSEHEARFYYHGEL